MAMKRKRSTPSLSPPSAPSSCPSASPSAAPPAATAAHEHPSADSIQHFYPQTKPLEPYTAIGKDWARRDHRNSGFELGSRTMKRHRDDRPDEATVHATTLSLLYAAQRRPHLSPPATPTGAPPRQSAPDNYLPSNDDDAGGMDVDGPSYFAPTPSSGEGAGTFPAQRATLERFWGAGRG